ncbi:putative uncharacterized protein DDB_G0282133 isoform X2 [Daktulosphaira vitifoliae]|uniref:putative uncharacterized protein DDB_G0282133 isoform X2 n=1 Tax=Daktulosphaira vitifoliae TaxID=58002 RepID=UPI0021AA8EF2|nr:putative uncharacterized protein DDB_G0282133 isoform X2 [Daktulosphaira vitifoliae]
MDSEWICTQAISIEETTNDNYSVTNFGCIILNNNKENEKYILQEGDNTIGRYPSNSIYIEHPSVSMYHAVIQCDSDGVVLLDKGSLNKTKLNQKNLKKNVAYFLDEDSLITFGDVQAHYYINSEHIHINNEKNKCPKEKVEIKEDDVNSIVTIEQNNLMKLKCITSKNSSNVSYSTEIIKEHSLQNSLSSTIINKSSSSDAFGQTESNKNNNLCSTFQSCFDKEDTPSPVMDLKGPLSDSYSICLMNKDNSFVDEKNILNNDVNDDSLKSNTETLREETPSPTMDLGLFVNYNISTQLGLDQINVSNNQVNIYNEETQLFEIDKNFRHQPLNVVNYAGVKENKLENLEISKELVIQKSEGNEQLKNSNIISQQDIKVSELDDDFFDCPTQKIELLKVSSNNVTEEYNENDNQTKDSINNLESLGEDTQIFIDLDFNTVETNKTVNLQNIKHFSDTEYKNAKDSNLTLSNILQTKKKENSLFKKPSLVSLNELETQISSSKNDFFDCSKKKVVLSQTTNTNLNITHAKNNCLAIDKNNFNVAEKQLPQNNNYSDHSTQKVVFFKTPQAPMKSISKCYVNILNKSDNLQKNESNMLNEVDTQLLSELNNDFFDCPTQKLNNKIEYKEIKNNEIGDNENIQDNYFDCPTQKLNVVSDNNKCLNKLDNNHVKPDMLYQNTTTKINLNVKNSSNNLFASQTDNQKQSSTKNFINTFEADDDDIFNCLTQQIIKPSRGNNTFNKENKLMKQELPINNLNMNQNNSIEEIVNKSKVVEIDLSEDFFNCPTQKISSHPKYLNQENILLNNIYEEETEIFECIQRKTIKKNVVTFSNNDEIHNITGINSNKINNDDFFNCPTQKISTSFSKNSTKKSVTDINEEETQVISGIIKPHKEVQVVSNNTIDISNEIETQLFNEQDDDFFNCPTQKISTSFSKNSTKKSVTDINEEETQVIPGLIEPHKEVQVVSNNTIDISNEIETQLFNEQDDDFFNCPTQKIPTSVSHNSTKNINENETEVITHLIKSNKVGTVVSNNTIDNSNEIETQLFNEQDDDFFNCPTQKIPTSVSQNSTKKALTDINEEEAQVIPCLIKPYKVGTVVSNNTIDIINGGETNNFCSSNLDITVKLTSNISDFPMRDKEEFYNCSTQKLSHDLLTNKDLAIVKSDLINIKKTKDKKTSISKLDTYTFVNKKIESFFDCHTQKIIANENSKVVLNSRNMNSGETQYFHMNNEDLNSNKFSPNIKNSNDNSSHNKNMNSYNEDYQKVLMKNKETEMSKVNVKPSIRIRSDLHNTNNFNRSNVHEITRDVINSDANLKNEKLHSPRRSKRILVGRNSSSYSINNISIKQEPIFDNENCLNKSNRKFPLKNTLYLKQMDETIYSPLNLLNSNYDILNSAQNANTHLDLPPCKPSTSSDAVKWQSFWNKKKNLSVENKNNCKMLINSKINNNDTINKKERYQTRAVTKKENYEDVSRKRKLNISVEENNKRICDDRRKSETSVLIKKSKDVIVMFSFLRNLQSMKYFVEKTGGCVTDDITQCSILVTDKIRCTMKILSAIARGVPVVTANWLKHSYTVKMFQDVDEFIVVDNDAERKYNFQLKESLTKARNCGLLTGYTVLVTPSVKPGPRDMKTIISCAGGNFVLNWPKTITDKALIVTCDNDRQHWKSVWDYNKASIIDGDTLVTSIIRQKLNF